MTQKTELYVPKGATANARYAVDIDPERAGWTHSSLRVVELGPDGTHTFTTGDSEWIVLSLNGGCSVRVSDESGASGESGESDTSGESRETGEPGGEEDAEFQILGRESVFAGVSDFVYAPRDARVQIASGAGGRFALAGAKCERRLPARYGPAPEVPVEDRGSGTCARQVRNFASADAFECDKLITVEVITPGGNWSSYPPHKHDENRPGEETALEEIYYFEIDGPHGFGYQRVSPSREGGSEVLAEVRSGDAVLVPDGWHGPSIAQPGHTMYYLNVMAGPGSERQWRICFHPDHTEGYR